MTISWSTPPVSVGFSVFQLSPTVQKHAFELSVKVGVSLCVLPMTAEKGFQLNPELRKDIYGNKQCGKHKTSWIFPSFQELQFFCISIKKDNGGILLFWEAALVNGIALIKFYGGVTLCPPCRVLAWNASCLSPTLMGFSTFHFIGWTALWTVWKQQAFLMQLGINGHILWIFFFS